MAAVSTPVPHLPTLRPDAEDPVLRALPETAAVYCVGGAVRDALLDQTSSDRDYLVVGSCPEEMTAAGFRPVGKDFPVFLHPATQAEYALARTERKSGLGYHGFTFHAGPEVTLEEDLARRDLTINAMAVGAAGDVIDPYGGLADLAARQMRHIQPAFAEDPVRILRLARFAARWPTFEVAPETFALCRQMVAAGEANALVPERVWAEISRGLLAAQPSKMVHLLVAVGAWGPATATPVPSAARLSELDGLATLDDATMPLAARAGLLFSETPAEGLPRGMPRAVHDWHRLLQPTLRESPFVVPSAEGLLSWLTQLDAFRQPERLRVIGPLSRPPIDAEVIERLQKFAQQPMGAVAGAAAKAKLPVPEAIRAERLRQLTEGFLA